MVDNRDMSFIQRVVDRTLESTKNDLWNKMVSMSNPQKLELKEGLLFCPSCGKFFSDEHVDRKPNFCEDCGQAFLWETNDFIK